MIPKWFTNIRGRVPSSASILLGIVPLAVLALSWWMMTHGIPEERVLGPTILPSPGEVVQSLHDLVQTSDAEGRGLLDHVGLSLRRVAFGFVLSLILVLPIGILMGSFGSARRSDGRLAGRGWGCAGRRRAAGKPACPPRGAR